LLIHRSNNVSRAQVRIPGIAGFFNGDDKHTLNVAMNRAEQSKVFQTDTKEVGIGFFNQLLTGFGVSQSDILGECFTFSQQVDISFGVYAQKANGVDNIAGVFDIDVINGGNNVANLYSCLLCR